MGVDNLPTPTRTPSPEPHKHSHEDQLNALARDLEKLIIKHCSETLEVDRRFTAVELRLAAHERRLQPLCEGLTQDHDISHEGGYYHNGGRGARTSGTRDVERRIEKRVAYDMMQRMEGWLGVVESRIMGIEKGIKRLDGVMETLEERIHQVEGRVGILHEKERGGTGGGA